MKIRINILLIIIVSFLGCFESSKPSIISTGDTFLVKFVEKEYQSIAKFRTEFDDWILNEIKKEPFPIVQFSPDPNTSMDKINRIKDVLKEHNEIVRIAIETKEGNLMLVRYPPKVDTEKIPNVENYQNRNILNLEIQEDGIYKDAKNGKKIAIDDIEKKLLPYILSDGSNPELPEYNEYSIPNLGKFQAARKLIVTITPNKNTKFADYQKLKWEILSTYNIAWNLKSKEIYNMEYDNLDKLKKDEIKKVIPLVLSELPTN